MGLFDWVSSGVNALFGSGTTTTAGVSDFAKAAAPTLIGGGLAYLGAQETASAARDAAAAQAAGLQAAAADAAAQGVPYSVGSLAGTAQFDPESKTALLNLSPELSNIYGGLLSRSGLFGQQAGELIGLDPFTAGNVFYQMGESYRQPERERLRTALETRLLSQGLLGSTSGGLQKQALETAILESQAKQQTESFSQAQALINSLLGRESADINQALQLIQTPIRQAELGRGIAGQITAAYAPALQARTAALTGLNKAEAISSTGMSLSAIANSLLNPKSKS